MQPEGACRALLADSSAAGRFLLADHPVVRELKIETYDEGAAVPQGPDRRTAVALIEPNGTARVPRPGMATYDIRRELAVKLGLRPLDEPRVALAPSPSWSLACSDTGVLLYDPTGAAFAVLEEVPDPGWLEAAAEGGGVAVVYGSGAAVRPPAGMAMRDYSDHIRARELVDSLSQRSLAGGWIAIDVSHDAFTANVAL